MSKQALGAFELDGRGNWICRKSVIVEGDDCFVSVQRGTLFPPHTAFAGYDDFTEHLDELAVESPPLAPHEWR